MASAITEKLGAWLLAKDHTREMLANELGITRPTLKERLEGTSDWRWGEVQKIAELTDSTLSELAS